MRVTAIEPRRKSLVEIYLDGQSAGQVDLETVERLRIRTGQELSDAEWSSLCAESDYTRARSYALWILSRRCISAKKLNEKLREKYSAEAAASAVARMQELGVIDDENYAWRCASDLIRLRHFSESRVMQELMQRGIDKELAREVATQSAQEWMPDPVEAVSELLKNRFAGRYAEEKDRRRTVAALQRMGYRWEDIRAALRRMECADEI